MVVTDDSDWPLPSQSHRVRMLLYLAEGMITGAGLTLFLLDFFGAFLIDIETGLFNPDLSAFNMFLLLIVLFLGSRVIAFIKAGNGFSRDNPSEYQDWAETRQWLWVAAVALSVGGTLLGVSVFLWGWWAVVFLEYAALLMLGMIFAGFVLYLSVLQRIGVKII